MQLEASALPSGSQLDADICIIGAGAAGITLAAELAGASTRVCLLEAGGLTFDRGIQERLCAGTFSGSFERSFPQYLSESRLCYFGGSTNHWAGWCRELDDTDFKERPWHPASGWPIGPEDLQLFYPQARSLVELSVSAEEQRKLLASEPFAQPTAEYVKSLFLISPPTRFAEKYRSAILDNPHLQLVSQAQAIGFETEGADPAAQRISAVKAGTAGGKSITVKAARFVIAAGGLENARLLLLLQQSCPAVNSSWIGRGFMDHPETTIGFGFFPVAPKSLEQFSQHLPAGWPHRCMAALYLRPEIQQRERLPQMSLQLTAVDLSQAPPEYGDMLPVIQRLAGGIRQTLVHLRLRQEPFINPDSRVTLSEQAAGGVPRLRLHWQLGANDADAQQRGSAIFSRALAMHQGARIKLLTAAEDPWRYMTFAAHHIGTTRMHADPRQGVTDANCAVRGVNNLYAAGSSLFPTAGISNPTLTLLALALRLARHLKGSHG